ncbi:MAG: nitroreductase [Bdellovibrionales bacterium]
MTVASPAQNFLDVLYSRRSVRNFKPKPLDQNTIRALLDAAIHAPTAMHEEPWSFVVIQDKKLLDRLSESAKEKIRHDYEGKESVQADHMLEMVNDERFHLFYNAGTLIVICCKNPGTTGVADSWLAAENLMLAACAKGLGSCVIGLAVGALNTPEWKEALGIPAGSAAVAPLIVGEPDGEASVVPRKPPEILTWK